MKRVGIADLKSHLSSHLRTVKKGEVIIVMDRNTPMARIVPAEDPRVGLVTRPSRRDLQSVKRMLQDLVPLNLPVDSLSILLEDRKR